MRIILKLAGCAAAAIVLASCGSEQRGPDGLTAEESEKLNAHAENLQNSDVVDTSPDSMVVDDNWIEAEAGGAETSQGNVTGNGAASNGQ